MSEGTSGAGSTTGSGTSIGAPSDEPSDVLPRVPLSRRPWVRRVGLGLLVGAIAAALVPAVVVFPYVRDDLRLDRVVRAVALDWRDFGDARARERLEFELDHQGVGPWVEDDDCTIAPADGGVVVRCAWGIALPIPGTDFVWPLTFVSSAAVDARGDLR